MKADINWANVYEVQYKLFRGVKITDSDRDLCRRAIAIDNERYRQIAADIKEEYKQMMRSI